MFMQILHEQKGNKGMFYIEDPADHDIQAQMVYFMTTPNEMIIQHTEVDEVLRGQNIGYQLVQHAVNYARQFNIKIIPVCPFAKSVFDRKPEFADVLA
jgi:predicted GNAT family acetyltransferase